MLNAVLADLKDNMEIANKRVIIVFYEALRLSSLCIEVNVGLLVDRYTFTIKALETRALLGHNP